ncbi:MAG: carboxypeptidase-like regulatory domain-containing protein [Bacteroidetes bacterium]|nr:carboxypeptidase-like regulatory domain-containing protein [Bacteroidota bacterium]
MKTLILSLVLFFSIQFLNAQQVEVKGVVKDSKTQTTLPFASISVTGTSKGTISNEDGYFSLSLPDSISDFVCTYVGYKKQIVKYESGKLLYIILMEPSEQMLREVTIRASDSDKLYELVAMIKKNKPTNITVAKSYFESKSYCDTQQVELVTAFYNLHSKGYEINRLATESRKSRISEIWKPNLYEY